MGTSRAKESEEGMGRVEFKDCGPGALLMIDGELTEAGLKRQAQGQIEYKVVLPPPEHKRQVVTMSPQALASLARCQTLLADIHASEQRIVEMSSRKAKPTPASHPVVQRALRLLEETKR
jgi:hypothetical protein